MDKYESKVKGTPLIYTPDGIQLGSNKLLFADMTDIAFREGATPAWTFAYKGRHMLVPYEEAEKEFVEPFVRNAMKSAEEDIMTLLEAVPAAPEVEAPNMQRNVEPPAVETPAVETPSVPAPDMQQTVEPEAPANDAPSPSETDPRKKIKKEKSNMTICKHCGAEIAKSAKKCPHCGGKNKKPIYKRVWFIILCIIVVFGIIGAIAGGGDEESVDVNTNNDTEVETTVEATEEAAEAEAPDPTADYSMEEKNCYQAALNYLDLMGFSKKGLIQQLSSEYGDNYPQETAEKVVNDLDEAGLVDWEKQAERSAQNYLDTMSFSKDELINQLCSDAGDQYTREEAEAAVEAVYK